MCPSHDYASRSLKNQNVRMPDHVNQTHVQGIEMLLAAIAVKAPSQSLRVIDLQGIQLVVIAARNLVVIVPRVTRHGATAVGQAIVDCNRACMALLHKPIYGIYVMTTN